MRITPAFDPTRSDIGSDNGFWVKGTDAQGEVVHLQAMRLDNLAGGDLHETLPETLMLYPPQDIEVCPSRSRVDGAALRGIGGSVGYQGELWLKGGCGGFRGRGLPGTLTRIGMLMAVLRWNPDHIWAIVSGRLVRCRMVEQYGYRNRAPDVLQWVPADGGPALKEWAIWMSRDDLVDLARVSGDGAGHEGNADILAIAA